MRIALDYDGTYTADSELWDDFIAQARAKGHTVYIVTYRDRRHDMNPDLYELDFATDGVIGTRGIAKEFYCEHFGPGKMDIWIEDKPQAVHQNSGFDKAQLEEWRAEQRNAQAL